jgi:Protein of unknwon function (DUF3310)
MTEANKRQIGGRHYKTDYEHWDLAAKIPLDYFEGSTTKYVARWRKKNGLEDLQKALHYLDKLIEVATYEDHRKLQEDAIATEVNNFALVNNLGYQEEEYILTICTYRHKLDLHEARLILEDIIQDTEEPNRPGTPEDGGHHAV